MTTKPSNLAIRHIYKAGYVLDFPGMPVDEIALLDTLSDGGLVTHDLDKLVRHIDFQGPGIYSWDDSEELYVPDDAAEVATSSRIQVSKGKTCT